MKTLPDPRRYVSSSLNPLVALAQCALGEVSATQHGKSAQRLEAVLDQLLRTGDDALIEQALAQAPSRAIFRLLSDALDFALRAPEESALHLRMFAIPILIVTGGRSPLVVPAVVPDSGALKAVFEAHGTLGPMKNFGLGSTLASAEGLAKLKPGILYRKSRETGAENLPQLDVPPEDIHLTGNEEQVHLRFLMGVSATSPDAPGFSETAGNIGAWGVAFTRTLAGQLGQPGLSLLPIPRPPMSLRQALEAGIFAQREIGLQLFLSAALRRFRSRVGEAQAGVAACADGRVRIRLSSPFDGAFSPEYEWTLQPGDDMGAVSNAIFTLLEECRVTDVQAAETVQPVSPSH